MLIAAASNATADFLKSNFRTCAHDNDVRFVRRKAFFRSTQRHIPELARIEHRLKDVSLGTPRMRARHLGAKVVVHVVGH